MKFKKTIITLAALTVINAHADQILVSAQGEDVSNCRVNHKCEIFGSHDIQIINDGDKEHHYKYNYLICAKKFGSRSDCQRATNTINVSAHKVWNNHHDFVSNPWFGDTGHFSYSVETQVVGYQQAIVEKKYSILVKD